MRGWIKFTRAAGSSSVKIRPSGHEAAEFFRENTWLRRVLKYLGHWTDRLLQSVIVPIVVAVLTVLILNYLGLNGIADKE
ncbi:hypothetical protein EDD52_11154 [Primorskyibacter sedentarius]|uniref:Uncharacterized protein n=2 Tax=Primorskyibacter sedentarius TaxID=745311 RepID=A0A4R3J7N7_9RHOB|nr:hypothetical protein EDD52_11154 [Primorskyibacter sedentarius]